MIDRQFRHAIAENLASYMRGEITTGDYLEQIRVLLGRRYHESSDAAAKSLCALAFFPPKARNHRISVDKDTWELMVRQLAFLESSLTDVAQADVPFRHVRLWVRLLAGLTPIAAVVAYCWWVQGIDGVTLGLGWLSFAPLAFLHNVKVRDDANMPVAPFGPFPSENEWLSHRHLAECFGIPLYDASVHHKPVPSGLSLRQQLFQVAITAPFAALAFACLVVFWPILVVGSQTEERLSREKSKRDAAGFQR